VPLGIGKFTWLEKKYQYFFGLRQRLLGEMGDRGSLEQALDGILGEAMGQGILDDQFIQLRTLQVILYGLMVQSCFQRWDTLTSGFCVFLVQDDSNPDFVKDLIDLYYMDAGSKIESLRGLLGQDNVDFQQMDQIVHQFKGSSSSFGAKAMADICVRLREGCHQQDVAGCRQICSELSIEFDRLKTTLNKFGELERQIKNS
jgi:histidine-containing phosphotransfer protein